MNILLFGKNGQLGWELRRTLAPLGPITALDYEDLDLMNGDALRLKISEAAPDLIVNASAYTDVDGAEKQPERAIGINGTAPMIMAQQAKALGALLVHYSTDYVFDGSKKTPHTEDDPTQPLNVYGQSKLAGENAVREAGGGYLILRTAWLYSMRGSNFVTKVLQWSRRHEKLHIVDDQVSNPTWARILAQLTAHVLMHGPEYVRERAGLYHLAGDGSASRFDWAKEILKYDPRPEEQKTTEVVRASTSDIPSPAIRPLYSALNCDRFAQVFGVRAPAWDHELRLALAETAD
ncbi:MAG TPA: dTDP-4-dehydrorhamnose reductase [Anaerolineales bacterium]|nr:dTDP-4-dehydrorhamnose reductase [Anaerolineales bacterium]